MPSTIALQYIYIYIYIVMIYGNHKQLQYSRLSSLKRVFGAVSVTEITNQR